MLLLIAFISFGLAWGFWTGRGWAWAVGLGVAIIGIIMGFLTLPGGLFRMLIDGFVIYYLTRPYVKRFFYQSRADTNLATHLLFQHPRPMNVLGTKPFFLSR